MISRPLVRRGDGIEIDWGKLLADTDLTKENVLVVNNKVEEMKATIILLNALVDKVANAPVVTEWWESE